MNNKEKEILLQKRYNDEKIFMSKIHKNDKAKIIDEIPKNLNLFSALYLFLSKISFFILFIFFSKFFNNAQSNNVYN